MTVVYLSISLFDRPYWCNDQSNECKVDGFTVPSFGFPILDTLVLRPIEITAIVAIFGIYSFKLTYTKISNTYIIR